MISTGAGLSPAYNLPRISFVYLSFVNMFYCSCCVIEVAARTPNGRRQVVPIAKELSLFFLHTDPEGRCHAQGDYERHRTRLQKVLQIPAPERKAPIARSPFPELIELRGYESPPPTG